MTIEIDPHSFETAMTFMALGIVLAMGMAAYHLLEGLWPRDRNKRKPPTNPNDKPPPSN